ncbi:MAG TPA: carotenoid biosynthesis protein [Ramlibacter sp.]|nr:carotenoid biosynthesis protein [Ramlibacter sp.]
MNSWRNQTPDTLLFAALAIGLLAWTAHSYSMVSVALVAASLGLAACSLWSCCTLLGARSARIFLGTGVVLGWLAEQAGATMGWFFGDYSYTDVLGPRVGAVPIVIPLMWFGLCYIGLLMGCMILWRSPAPVAGGGWKAGAFAALLAAMIVTAFDLGADPWFVFQLKAWIMAKKDGHWFGETVRGFEGWMVVSFTIIALFQAMARPAAVPAAPVSARRAALAPILVYAAFIAFQVTQSQPLALRFIAFFAMGIPALAALAAWSQWSRQLPGSAA